MKAATPHAGAPLSPAPSGRGHRGGRAGQTLIFMALVLVILALVVLWYFDVHKILYVKYISRNGGDAAAMAAARWQGITLNLIGELNVLKALAVTEALSRDEADFGPAHAIDDLQQRLNFVGPLVGLVAAQQAAKNNGLYVNDAFTDDMRQHAYEARKQYPGIYQSPPMGWDGYADMLDAVADQGVVARQENVRFFSDYVNYDHHLLNPGFYDAIASAGWCWFHWNAMALLRQYGSWRDWPPLPLVEQREPTNSEYFGLHLRRVVMLGSLALPGSGTGMTADNMEDLMDRLENLADQRIDDRVADADLSWFCYDERAWSSWTKHLPDAFPFDRPIKAKYEYVGADAAVLIETAAEARTPGIGEKTVRWTAAAKPFGSLDEETTPNAYGLVLPAFDEVRLIPVDASTAPAAGTRPGWSEHIRRHLPDYVARGTGKLVPRCWYCRQLAVWEQTSFRRAGLNWLAQNAGRCVHVGGPGGPGGGTRRGH